MDQSIEQWRPIAGYESLYEVSDFGRVRSLDGIRWNGQKMHKFKGRLLILHGNKYLHVILSRRGAVKPFKVHALVATAFLSPCPGIRGRGKGCYHIDHVNRDTKDNRACNLRWLTMEDNVFAENPNSIGRLKGSRHFNAKLTESQVLAIRSLSTPAKDVARECGISKDYVYRIRKRETWVHI
jgi:hypothetical protein